MRYIVFHSFFFFLFLMITKLWSVIIVVFFLLLFFSKFDYSENSICKVKKLQTKIQNSGAKRSKRNVYTLEFVFFSLYKCIAGIFNLFFKCIFCVFSSNNTYFQATFDLVIRNSPWKKRIWYGNIQISLKTGTWRWVCY